MLEIMIIANILVAVGVLAPHPVNVIALIVLLSMTVIVGAKAIYEAIADLLC